MTRTRLLAPKQDEDETKWRILVRWLFEEESIQMFTLKFLINLELLWVIERRLDCGWVRLRHEVFMHHLVSYLRSASCKSLAECAANKAWIVPSKKKMELSGRAFIESSSHSQKEKESSSTKRWWLLIKDCRLLTAEKKAKAKKRRRWICLIVPLHWIVVSKLLWMCLLMWFFARGVVNTDKIVFSIFWLMSLQLLLVTFDNDFG